MALGIDAGRLEGIEERLKADILAEADNNSAQGNMLVHTEEELGEIRACWCSAHQRTVKVSDTHTRPPLQPQAETSHALVFEWRQSWLHWDAAG